MMVWLSSLRSLNFMFHALNPSYFFLRMLPNICHFLCQVFYISLVQPRETNSDSEMRDSHDSLHLLWFRVEIHFMKNYIS